MKKGDLEECGDGLGDGVGGSWRIEKGLELRMKLGKIDFGDFKKWFKTAG